MLLPQFLANGLVIGSGYVLVAVGLTLIFGILHIVNFAHGEFYMLGGFAAVLGTQVLGLPALPALLVVALVMAAFGLLAERIIFRPISGKDPTNAIIASFGLSVLLQNVMLKTVGAEPMVAHSGFAPGAIQIGNVFITPERLAIVGVTVLIVAALLLVLRYTWTGRALRALSANPTVALISGVNVKRVSLITFVIGSVLAGISGALMSTVFMVQPNSGTLIVMKAFIIVVVAGMGSVEGAIVAGLALGLIESMVAGYIGNQFRDIAGFLIVIIVLTLRPQGLFGLKTERS